MLFVFEFNMFIFAYIKTTNTMKRERINAELVLLKMTQEEFSKKIGFKKLKFYSIMQRQTTSIKNLIIICEGLNLSVDYVLGLKEEKR